MQTYRAGDSPNMGLKGSGLFGNAISVCPSQPSPLGVSLKYQGGSSPKFIWWLENFDGTGARQVEQQLVAVAGFQSPTDSGHVNVLAFACYLHTDRQLKVNLLHFRGNFPGSESNDPVRDEYTYRSGLFLHDG